MIQPQAIINVADNTGAKKVMCIKCGAIIREKYMKSHVKTKSCNYPHSVPLKKRNLINLKEQIDSDDDEYFKL